MRPPKLSRQTVRQLRRDLQSRCFAIPKLQRNFVWDAGRAAKLLDSIYHNMPIGSLFLWEMDRKSAHLIRQSDGVLPSFNVANSHIWFVIDGQQRLSVLFQAFEGQQRENDAGRKIDFGRLCFVVSPDPDQDRPVRIVYRKPQGNELVPIRDILAPDWRARMPSRAVWFRKRVKECRDRLMRYPVPLVTVTRASLEEIGEIFIRVNSQGMRITSVDRAIALMGALDVRAMAQEVRHRVGHDVFELPGIDPILMGFNLITEKPDADGDPPKLDAMARRWSRRIENKEEEKAKFKKLWHRYQNAFLDAVDYLHRKFPVHDESYLPSANMLATLSVFFYHHPGQPNRKQATEIRKWFWATGVAQRYTGAGYHSNIVADTKFFAALALSDRRRFVFKDYVDPVSEIQAAKYSSRAALTRVFFCLLASLKPRYLETGEPISLEGDVVSNANIRHRHHIFPQAQMKNHFPSRVYNGLCNICFLVARDNLLVGMKRPRTYLTQCKHQYPQWFAQVMRSHLIPAGNDSGVWSPGIASAFKKFRKQRLHMICAAFEQAAGIRLFTRS